MPAQFESRPKMGAHYMPKSSKARPSPPMPDGHRAGQGWARAFQMGFTYAGEWKKIQSILIPVPLLLQIFIPILIPIPQQPNIYSHSKRIHTYGKK